MFFNKNRNAIPRRIDKANALFDRGKRNEAVQEFLNLQKEFPKNPGVMFGLAMLYNSTRQPDLAIEILKSILLIDKDHESTKSVLPTIIYEYAVQLSETGKKESAKKLLLNFIELANDNKTDLANGYKELALIEESSGNSNDARKFIQKAIEINERNEKNEYTKADAANYRNILNRLASLFF